MRPLFGTDGIRGEAGTPPLDDATVSRVGAALVSTLLRRHPLRGPVSILVGCDTRESSERIVACLAGGIASTGGRVAFAGILPTPGVAWLTQELSADAGVSVSASHNPWRDNGIKIFSAAGRKLPDEVEHEVEREILVAPLAPPASPPEDPSLRKRYLGHLVGTLPARLDRLKVVVDAANGAAFTVGPDAFRAAGADVVPLHVEPNGRNINSAAGALHPQAMIRAVVDSGADLGIALDGDADRIVTADETGALLDGDDILLLWSLELTREGRRPAAVVGTVMSNLGLERALSREGIRLLRAPVGDRYVAEEMERQGALLGGEPSGHLIRSDLTTTGDGILTGLHLASFVAARGEPLSRRPRIDRTPQVLRNVRVRERIPFESLPAVSEAVQRGERRLGENGRILLRYSGTEPLARVMVEGTDGAAVNAVADELAEAVRGSVGS